MRTMIPLLIAAALASALQAQDSAGPPESQVGAPPAAVQPAPISRAARLSWFHGDLQVQHADNTASTPTPNNPNPESAVLNMPIPEGSRLVTGDDAEAEIEFEDGSVARMTPKSALSLDSLSASGKTASTRLSLLSGLAYFELRHAATATYIISAGTLLASPADNVVFRIALDQPPALVSVLSGTLTVSADNYTESSAEASAPTGFTATVKAGECLTADPNDPTRYFLNPQLAENDWDTWNQSRDVTAETEAATRTTARDDYAGTQGFGWSDLDANGTWYSVTNPDGSTSELWQPTIAADPGPEASGSADAGDDADAFDPYGEGAFVYSGGAYLWASGYSWGWLPYRCGRWNYYPLFGWGWSPNRVCRTIGFGGAGGINIGRHPRRYNVVRFPPITPIHPIIRVHTGDPRTPVAPRGIVTTVKLAGLNATPLLPLAAPVTPVSGFVGGSLYRDFPVQAETHKPILGTIAAPVTVPTAVYGLIESHPAPGMPQVIRPPATGSYLRPALPYRYAPPPPAGRPAPAPAPAPPSKPK